MGINHQDTLNEEEIKSLLASVHGKSVKELERLYSEDHQVYKYNIEGHQPLVIKIAGKGKYRDGKIRLEIRTIRMLQGRVRVPDIIMSDIGEKPFFIMPYYFPEKITSDEILISAFVDYLTSLAFFKNPSALIKFVSKVRILSIYSSLINKIESNSFLADNFPGIEKVKTNLKNLIWSDRMITGQSQPGNLILTENGYIVVDWAEGIEPCPLNKQVGFATFWYAVNDIDRAFNRLQILSSHLLSHGFPVSIPAIKEWWLLNAIYNGHFYLCMNKSLELFRKYSTFYKELKEFESYLK